MPVGIGETLRAARRQQGGSLADAAAATRVRETYLAALEEEDFAALGGEVYAKGFLRNYAKFLGLDPDPLVDAYRREYGADQAAPPLAPEPSIGMPRRPQPAMTVIAVAGGLVLLVLVGIGLFGGSDGEGEGDDAAAPGPSPAESPVDEPSPTASPEESVEEEEPGDVEGLEVVVSVVGESSWMRVTVDDGVVLEGTRSNGFTESYEGEEEILVRVGDASAVTVEANGQDQGDLGDSGQVVVVTCAEGETSCDLETVPS